MLDTQNILSQIASLRSALSNQADGDCIDALLNRLSDRTRKVIEEHEGMALDLLGLYEQLGAVFEIARRFTLVENEREVVSFLHETLLHTFSRCSVEICWTPGGCVSIEGDARLTGLCRKAAEERAVQVTSLDSGPLPDGDSSAYVEAMIAPIGPQQEVVCLLVIRRTADEEVFKASDMSLLEVLSTFCGDLISNLRLHRELRQISVDLVRSLVSAVDQKDRYTCGHSMRVGFYARWLGKAIGLGQRDLQMLEWSALLHDVGKIGIRDEVLKKPGKLTDAEFEHIKEHPVRSYDVVRRVPQLRDALDGIRHHHERFDGRGYPDGLSGEAIPLQARIIQVADIFDALTSSRSYRKAFDWPKALEILEKEAGQTADPLLVRVFAGLVRRLFGNNEAAWGQMTRYGVEDGAPPVDTDIGAMGGQS